MEETMNTGVEEVTTEVFETEEVDQEITIDETSGPSKGFIALAAGGIAAIVVGTIVAVKRHKKKKADAQKEDQFEEGNSDESPSEEEVESLEPEIVEKSGTKTAKNKK